MSPPPEILTKSSTKKFLKAFLLLALGFVVIFSLIACGDEEASCQCDKCGDSCLCKQSGECAATAASCACESCGAECNELCAVLCGTECTGACKKVTSLTELDALPSFRGEAPTTLSGSYDMLTQQIQTLAISNIDLIPLNDSPKRARRLGGLVENYDVYVLRIPKESNAFYSCCYIDPKDEIHGTELADAALSLTAMTDKDDFRSIITHYQRARGVDFNVDRWAANPYTFEFSWYEIPKGEEIPRERDGKVLIMITESKRCYFEDLDGNVIKYLDVAYENPSLEGQDERYVNPYIQYAYELLSDEHVYLVCDENRKGGAYTFEAHILGWGGEPMVGRETRLASETTLLTYIFLSGLELEYSGGEAYVSTPEVYAATYAEMIALSEFQSGEIKTIETDGTRKYLFSLERLLAKKG